MSSSSESSSMRSRLVVAWTVVTVPLVYGVVETLNRAAKLFTG